MNDAAAFPLVPRVFAVVLNNTAAFGGGNAGRLLDGLGEAADADRKEHGGKERE